MTPPQWGIPVVLALGVAVIAFGWWWDRRRHRRLGEGFTTEDDLAALSPVAAPDPTVDTLLTARSDAEEIPGRLADAAFLSHPAKGVAVAEDPLMLITDASIDDDRLLLDALAHAQRLDRPLIIVAAGFGLDALGTLRANLLAGRVRTLPIELRGHERREHLAPSCGCAVTPDADLRSGWLPPSAWGGAAFWIADPDRSWFAPRPPGEPA